ncbi:hypothetical protein PHISCL_10968, partial [Aspergillus sclerotialis]
RRKRQGRNPTNCLPTSNNTKYLLSKNSRQPSKPSWQPLRKSEQPRNNTTTPRSTTATKKRKMTATTTAATAIGLTRRTPQPRAMTAARTTKARANAPNAP